MARPVCNLSPSAPRHSGRSFDMKPTNILLAMVLAASCALGCATSPRIVSRQQFDLESERLMPLSSYHRDYLGSDDSYHYIRIGIAAGSRDYRVLKMELSIKNTYPYLAGDPRIEPLLPKLSEGTPR
jgi:hypothetical protein